MKYLMIIGTLSFGNLMGMDSDKDLKKYNQVLNDAYSYFDLGLDEKKAVWEKLERESKVNSKANKALNQLKLIKVGDPRKQDNKEQDADFSVKKDKQVVKDPVQGQSAYEKVLSRMKAGTDLRSLFIDLSTKLQSKDEFVRNEAFGILERKVDGELMIKKLKDQKQLKDLWNNLKEAFPDKNNSDFIQLLDQMSEDLLQNDPIEELKKKYNIVNTSGYSHHCSLFSLLYHDEILKKIIEKIVRPYSKFVISESESLELEKFLNSMNQEKLVKEGNAFNDDKIKNPDGRYGYKEMPLLRKVLYHYLNDKENILNAKRYQVLSDETKYISFQDVEKREKELIENKLNTINLKIKSLHEMPENEKISLFYKIDMDFLTKELDLIQDRKQKIEEKYKEINNSKGNILSSLVNGNFREPVEDIIFRKLAEELEVTIYLCKGNAEEIFGKSGSKFYVGHDNGHFFTLLPKNK